MLTEQQVGSVIVCDDHGTPIGIITDRDLRRKVVAAGREPGTVLASEIMSAPLVTVEPTDFAFDAVLEMTRRGIHHLVVAEQGRLAGVLSTFDLLRLHAAHPVTLAREIDRAEFDVLPALARRITGLVRQLFDAGGTAADIGQIVAELNDGLTRRVLATASETLAGRGQRAPVPWCWLVFGSEARKEQTLRTDLDNGLVYANPPPDLIEQAGAYFSAYAAAAIDSLITVGFPRCEANLMASNPQWRRPVADWTARFRQWMTEAWPDQVAAALTLFDFRPLAGDARLADTLLALIRTEGPAASAFLSVVAREAIAVDSAVSFWGRIAVERQPPHRGLVDVKRSGTQQLVGAGRVYALEFGLAEMNTRERLRAAGRLGVYGSAELREILDALEFLMRLRLGHQLGQVERGTAPDNWINPDTLSRTEAVLLREALRTVERVKTAVSKRYGLASVPGV